jgi:ribosomal protein S18 acetylase RimI-like enzyme
VADQQFSIRTATAADLPFLTDMLIEAVNWHPLRDWDRARILSDPTLTHYVDGWPRPGDLGVVAVAAGTPVGTAPVGAAPVGAAWLRLLPADDPGFGFIAPDIPELTIGVAASWRGRGAGRALLRALVAGARAAGLSRISLSVERANRAQTLYEREGFVAVHHDTDSDTMVLTL